jgi:leucyl aminopeptidase
MFLYNLGRLVMADPLCYMKELAVKEVNPQLFTIATLTGHAARTYGDGYTVKKSS